MRLITLSAFVLASQIWVTQSAFAEHALNSLNENTVPEKVYIQNANDISRSGENCSYNDEHQHIHCYEDDNQRISQSEPRIVYRTSNRTYRDREYYPSTLSLGLAVGIPLLLHSSHYDNSYQHGYRSHNRHHRKHYRSYRRNHHGGHRY